MVQNPSKSTSPLPAATYVPCDHTTASVTFFLQAFQRKNWTNRLPVMFMCDGSLVLLRSISVTFCRTSFENLLHKYFILIIGQHPSTFDMPILRRCLSHIMKHAKGPCTKTVCNSMSIVASQSICFYHYLYNFFHVFMYFPAFQNTTGLQCMYPAYWHVARLWKTWMKLS